jgi:hypothetical protein
MIIEVMDRRFGQKQQKPANLNSPEKVILTQLKIDEDDLEVPTEDGVTDCRSDDSVEILPWWVSRLSCSTSGIWKRSTTPPQHWPRGAMRNILMP